MKNEMSRGPVELSDGELDEVAGGWIAVGFDFSFVVPRTSRGVTIAFPDVSKTPAPAGPVPIPYPIGHPIDTEKGTGR